MNYAFEKITICIELENLSQSTCNKLSSQIDAAKLLLLVPH